MLIAVNSDRAHTRALLRRAGQTYRTVGEHVGHGTSWAFKVLNGEQRIDEYDAGPVADLLCMDVEDLFYQVPPRARRQQPA